MKKDLFTLDVYDPATQKTETIEVTEAIYHAFRRTDWNMEKNDQKHSANTTPFSALIGGENGAYENFDEFISDKLNPEHIIGKELLLEKLSKAVESLAKSEQSLVRALFFDGKSERVYAEEIGVYHNAVHKRKLRILAKLKKFIES